MYLSRFGVKNYKCLGDIDIPLTPIHVLIGENDAGKTSLLEAMAAYCASPERPLDGLFPQPWSGRELVRHGQSQATVEFWGRWATLGTRDLPSARPKLQYGFVVDFPEEGRTCWRHSEWIEVDGEMRPIAAREKRPKTTTVREFRLANALHPDVSTDDLAAAAEVLRPAHQYAFNPRVMRLPAAIDPKRKQRLDPDGFGLPTLLGDILEYDAELFLRLRSEFCRLFPQFRSVHIESENAFNRIEGSSGTYRLEGGLGKALYLDTHTDGPIRGEQASDGAILMLGFLALAHLPAPPRLLLIEEPENAIYPKRLEQVITMLKEMAEGVQIPQIVITTHSPYVLSFFDPEEVTFLSRPKDQPHGPVRARRLRDAPKIKEGMGSEFYLGELWYNLTEEELFRDA
jgi:predicted ATPase